MNDDLSKGIREALFDAIETSLACQLNAVRKLRLELGAEKLKPKKRLSQPVKLTHMRLSRD